MSRIGLGYGSEWHMLHLLGRHRTHFTSQVIAITGGSDVKWLDFDFTTGIAADKNHGDAELRGANSLAQNHPARKAWTDWRPRSGNVHN